MMKVYPLAHRGPGDGTPVEKRLPKLVTWDNVTKLVKFN